MQFGNFQPNRANQNINMPDMGQWKPWLPIVIVAFCIFIFVLMIVITWLRSRGNFIFTDCVVRNRGAIAEPWREYRKEGNSYFLFQLVVVFASMTVIAAVAVIVLSIAWLAGGRDQLNPIVLICSAVFFFLCWIVLGAFLNVVMYFMAPVMFVRRCRAIDAFREVARLVVSNPMPFVLFCLFGIVLLLAMIVIGGIATCATCCLAAIPYVGTVILLPMFVCLRLFGLLFLRQFGPDYDVWATLPQPEVPPIPPPLPT